MKIKQSYDINFNARAFVVRNYAFPFNQSAMRHDGNALQYLNMVSLMNGCGPLDPDKDPIVELWWASDELGSSDLQQAVIPYNDFNITINFRYLQHVPLKVLQRIGAQEGMSCDIRIPVIDVKGTDDMNVTVTISALFQQAGSRYEYGTPTFEDAIEWVTRDDAPWAPKPPKKECKCEVPQGCKLPPELESFLLRTKFSGQVRDYGNGMYVLVIGGPK